MVYVIGIRLKFKLNTKNIDGLQDVIRNSKWKYDTMKKLTIKINTDLKNENGSHR